MACLCGILFQVYYLWQWHACVEYYFKTNCRPNHENKVKQNRQSLDSSSIRLYLQPTMAILLLVQFGLRQLGLNLDQFI